MLESENKDVEIVGKEVSYTPPPTVDELLEKLNSLGEELRALIVRAKKLPRDKGLEPHQDPVRALSLAQANLQAGFMWLRKAITTPKEF